MNGFDTNGWPKRKREFRLSDFLFEKCVPAFIFLCFLAVIGGIGWVVGFHIMNKCVRTGYVHQPASCTDYGNGSVVCLPDRYEQGCVEYQRR